MSPMLRSTSINSVKHLMQQPDPRTDNEEIIVEKLVTTSEICERYGKHMNTICRWRKERGFPRPLLEGGHGSQARWRLQDIMEWEERQLAR